MEKKMIQCKSLDMDNKYLHIEVVDGRIISTPLTWYKSLMSASPEQRANYRLIARNTMIEWSELDLHLDIEEMFKVDVGNTEQAA
jgi:hypothetical protein